MARKKTASTQAGDGKRPIETYEHKDKQRVNNPPVGLVTPETDPESGEKKKSYAYDPHLDPQLQWAGKAEHTSFDVPTVSLHVHERIDPRTIIEAVRRAPDPAAITQLSLFQTVEENPPLREAIEFYKHAHGWSNRFIAGDSLLVMNSLLEKEGMAGTVQMSFIDPPYGIKYGSNFQPFVNKREVKDGKDEDLTAEPEQIRAFRDTWELGIHSYLTYLRDRLLLERELLTESGSVFVQISDENIHHVRELMDEVFGAGNFVSLIPFVKTSGQTDKYLATISDYLLWYCYDANHLKYHQLYSERTESTMQSAYTWIELADKTSRKLTRGELIGIEPIPEGRRFMSSSLFSQGFRTNTSVPYKFQGKTFDTGHDKNWKTTIEGLDRLANLNRLLIVGSTLCYKRYADDFPVVALNNFWSDTVVSTFVAAKLYIVQTATKVIQRCILMTTDPGDLVMDITCGSGTTSFVSEQWGRRWITCDTSRVALTLAKQRLMTAVFDYYELAHPQEGVGSGFVYKTVPHVTLKSVANNEPPATETLYDQPLVDRKRNRVSGPFTVEAVPAPTVKSVEEIIGDAPPSADASIARSGETLRQSEWRDELLRAGIRGKAGQHFRFARIEPLPGCRWLHADGETRPSAEGADRVREDGTAYSPQRIVVSFGPEHAPLEQRQVEHAWEEARTLVPRPKLLVFAAFQFDPEAAKDIDEMKPELAGMQFLKVQMNADLLTDDLKKKRASNESFWLIGQPDVRLEKITAGEDMGKWRVSVQGFDYYNTKTGGIESGGSDRIAVWLLDTDYDGRSLFPRQVFFPMAGDSEGWAKLARNLKAEIDEELIEAYRGTVSLPFEPGKHQRIAVKIVDDRGIESLKVMEVA
ncbi:MAG: DNA methyltransferase [Deltaproteobacteria bacterium]|nr:DNA methyltransferase [Deltaproteobacteria bacterium]